MVDPWVEFSLTIAVYAPTKGEIDHLVGEFTRRAIF
jgi:hypothetical protein